MQRAVGSLDSIQRQIPVPGPTAGARHAPGKLHPASESALVSNETASVVDRHYVALSLAKTGASAARISFQLKERLKKSRTRCKAVGSPDW